MKITVTMDRNTLARMILLAAYTTAETLRNTAPDAPEYEERMKERDFYADLDEDVLMDEWDEIARKLSEN